MRVRDMMNAAIGIASTVLASGPAGAASYKYLNLDPPGATITMAMALNNAGQVALWSNIGTFGWKNGVFTRLIFPPPGEGGQPVPTAISPWGLVVGWWLSEPYFGFAYSTIQQRVYPLNIAHFATFPYAINASGDVTGELRMDRIDTAFIYRYGRYILLNPPGAEASAGMSINDRGEVVGSAGLAKYDRNQGFHYAAGHYEILSKPGAIGTYPAFIVNSGDILGSYEDPCGNDAINGTIHGFVLSHGSYRTIDFQAPAIGITELVSRNSAGETIGSFSAGLYSPYGGFRISGGVQVRVDLPFADVSYVTLAALNEAGSFIGNYRVGEWDGAPSHAFIAVCDPPGSRCGD